MTTRALASRRSLGTSRCRPRRTSSANRSASGCKTTTTGQLRVYSGLQPEAASLWGGCGVLPGPLCGGGHGGRGASARGWAPARKTDSVWINGSWSGRLGPVRGLLQGNLLVGTARGGTGKLGVPAGVAPGRDYDIFAGAAIAYVELDLGIVQPFVGFVYGSGDGDPTDRKLHGFQTQTVSDRLEEPAPGCLITLKRVRSLRYGTTHVRRAAGGDTAAGGRAGNPSR